MKTLPIIGLVAASLVMGSGVAGAAKGKKHKNKGNPNKIVKVQKGQKANRIRRVKKVYTAQRPHKNRKFQKTARKVLKVLRHVNNGNGRNIWNNGCVRPHKIRKRLIRRGWHNLNVVNVNRRVLRVKATNYNGRRFVLRVDRCDGDILSRRPVRKLWRY